MPLTPVAYGELCLGPMSMIADEDDVEPKLADLELRQLRHVVSISADIDHKDPSTCADAANGGRVCRFSALLCFRPSELAC